MPRTRLNTLPKTTIHRTGCTARARTSVGSRRSFFSSISAMAAVCWKNAKTADRSGSAETASCAPGCADVTIASLLLNGTAAVMNEDVVERGAGSDAGFQVGRRADGGNFAEMHDGQGIAELLGFVHAMGGDQDGHLIRAAQLEQAFPDRAASDGIESDGGLIEKQNGGAVQHGLRDFQTPDHAAGVCLDELTAEIGESHEPQGVFDAALALGAGDA